MVLVMDAALTWIAYWAFGFWCAVVVCIVAACVIAWNVYELQHAQEEKNNGC